MKGRHTYHEIKNQERLWQEVAREVLKNRKEVLLKIGNKKPIFTGAGTSYYLSMSASFYAIEKGYLALAIPPSELLVHENTYFKTISPDEFVLLPVSRSGTTSETLKASRKFKERGGTVIPITCSPESPMAKLGEVLPSSVSIKEKSVVMTSSFTTMLLQALVIFGGEEILEKLENSPAYRVSRFWEVENLAKEIVSHGREHFYFMGSGLNHGIAQEMALKMKEMSLTPLSQAYHPLEYRHGPVSVYGEKSQAIMVSSPESIEHDVKLAEELVEKSGKDSVVVLHPEETTPNRKPAGVVFFEAPAPYPISSLFGVVLAQLMGYYTALLKNLDPDRPKNLVQVVKIDI